LKRQAFTILELLVSMAIVVMLAGLLFGTHVVAKRHAFHATNAVRLRQIGVALELYAQDHGAMPLRSLQVIADEKYLQDDRLLKSPLETYSEGYANHLDKCLTGSTLFGGNRVQSDIHPFVPWSDDDPSVYEHMKQWNDNPGLVADLSLGVKASNDCFFEFTGTFHRLQGDLSVVVRNRKYRNDGPGSYLIFTQDFFIDEFPEGWWQPN